MTQLRLTLTVDFEANPEEYKNGDNKEIICKIEETNCNNDFDYLVWLLKDVCRRGYTCRVTVPYGETK